MIRNRVKKKMKETLIIEHIDIFLFEVIRSYITEINHAIQPLENLK